MPKIILSYMGPWESMSLIFSVYVTIGNMERGWRDALLWQRTSAQFPGTECSRGFETPLASVSAKKDLVPVARGSHCEVTALAAGPFCSVSQSLGLRVNHLVHLRFCFYLERRLGF